MTRKHTLLIVTAAIVAAGLGGRAISAQDKNSAMIDA